VTHPRNSASAILSVAIFIFKAAKSLQLLVVEMVWMVPFRQGHFTLIRLDFVTFAMDTEILPNSPVALKRSKNT
jgi:hypothetical protein